MNTIRSKKYLVFGLAVLVFLLSACSTQNQSEPIPTNTAIVTEAPTEAPLPTATPNPASSVNYVPIDSAAIAANLIGEDPKRILEIYLPANYETSTTRYPVVYYLPGFSDGSIYMSLPQDMDKLIAAGEIQDMIVVVVPGNNKLGGSFFVNSPVTGNWEDFVVNEVVSFIDGKYRTIAQADSRGISGHSMGGFGALNIAMHHPDVFSAVYSVSPGLFDQEGLANSQLFRNDAAISAFIKSQKDVLTKPSDVQLKTVLASYDKFSVAYGMTFAPNPENIPYYFDYPYSETNGTLVRDDQIWKQWDSGYGGIAEEVAQYKDNLMKLKGIVVEYGTKDEYKWIPQGCAYFDAQLTSSGIPHEMVVHEGTHMSKLDNSIKKNMMPFFSNLLVRE